MGWDSGLNKRFWDAPQFYILYTFLIAASATIILVPNAPLLTIMVLSQVVNGSLLPFVLIFMLLLINNKKQIILTLIQKLILGICFDV